MAREAGQVEARLHAAFGQRREIHPRGDVLQPGMDEGISVSAVAKMAHQGAVAPLRQVVLRPRQPVVEPKDGAPPQALNDRAGPGGQTRAVFGDVLSLPASGGGRKPRACPLERRAGRPRRPGEGAFHPRDAEFLAGRPAANKAGDWQRIQHLVRDDHAVKGCGRGVHPLEARQQMRDAVGEQLPLALAQIRAHVENEVLLRQPVESLEPGQDVHGQAAAAGAELQDRSRPPIALNLGALLRHAGAEQG